MKRNAIIGAAGALAVASCLSAGAVRSCSLERNATGFDSRLPIPEGMLTLSCTEWIGSSHVCMARAEAFGRSAGVTALGSPRHAYGELAVSIPFTNDALELSGGVGKGISAKVGQDR